MDKFNLREYLKNNPLLKEEKVFSVSLTNKDRDEELVVYVKGTNSEDEALKKVLASNKMKQYPEFTSHLETMDLDYEDYGLEDEEEEQFEGDLAFFDVEPLAENNPLLKENIDFPELEDEFEGAMDAMVVEPEIYLQDIIDDPSVVLGDDYFEVYNAVEDGIYSEDEAVELAKKWATDKLSGLAENKTLNELELDFYDEDDPNAVTLTAQSGEYDGDVEDGMVSFSVYDEYEEFDEDNWEDILGSNHAFSQISNKIPTKVEADGDYVQITVKIDDLKGIAK